MPYLDPKKINVGSRGEIVAQLIKRCEAGRVKDCMHLRLDRRPAGFLPVCEEEWAGMESDSSVDASYIPGYGGAMQVDWPRCPENCPKYIKSDALIETAGRDQYDDEPPRTKPSESVPIAAPPAPSVEPEIAGRTIDVPLEHPERVTLAWLWMHVPVLFWLWLLGALGAVFIAGISVGQLSVVRELFTRDAGKAFPTQRSDIAVPTAPATRGKR